MVSDLLDKEPQITGETAGAPAVIEGSIERGARGRFAKGASGNSTGRFQKGQSGNPNGRPRGSGKFRAGSRAAAALLDTQAEALAGKAIEMAFAGDRSRCGFASAASSASGAASRSSSI
jgi:hypothetical protein